MSKRFLHHHEVTMNRTNIGAIVPAAYQQNPMTQAAPGMFTATPGILPAYTKNEAGKPIVTFGVLGLVAASALLLGAGYWIGSR